MHTYKQLLLFEHRGAPGAFPRKGVEKTDIPHTSAEYRRLTKADKVKWKEWRRAKQKRINRQIVDLAFQKVKVRRAGLSAQKKGKEDIATTYRREKLNQKLGRSGGWDKASLERRRWWQKRYPDRPYRDDGPLSGFTSPIPQGPLTPHSGFPQHVVVPRQPEHPSEAQHLLHEFPAIVSQSPRHVLQIPGRTVSPIDLQGQQQRLLQQSHQRALALQPQPRVASIAEPVRRQLPPSRPSATVPLLPLPQRGLVPVQPQYRPIHGLPSPERPLLASPERKQLLAARMAAQGQLAAAHRVRGLLMPPQN